MPVRNISPLSTIFKCGTAVPISLHAVQVLFSVRRRFSEEPKWFRAQAVFPGKPEQFRAYWFRERDAFFLKEPDISDQPRDDFPEREHPGNDIMFFREIGE